MSTNGDPTNTTNRNIYFSKDNLKKLDDARGAVKRSTAINKILEYIDEDYIKSVLQ